MIGTKNNCSLKSINSLHTVSTIHRFPSKTGKAKMSIYSTYYLNIILFFFSAHSVGVVFICLTLNEEKMMQIYEEKKNKTSRVKTTTSARSIRLLRAWETSEYVLKILTFSHIFHQLNFEFHRDQISFCFGVARETD